MSSRHELRGTGWKRKERVCVAEKITFKQASSHYAQLGNIPNTLAHSINGFISVDALDYAIFFDARTAGAEDNFYYLLDNRTDGNVQPIIFAPGFQFYSGVSPQSTSGRLHMVTFTFDGAIFKIYFNGRFVSESAYTPPAGLVLFDNARIGKNNGGFHSTISAAHYSIFDRALTVDEIATIHQLGGVLPTGVHAACVSHLHKAEGRKWFDCVEQYNSAKATALTNTHADLMNYTDAQLTGHIVDFYTGAVISDPAVKNGISGSITYPSGTEIISVGGYNVIAYKAHTPLTKREKLEMNSNTWPVDAPSWVRSKLTHYYLHNEVITGEVVDLVGSVNAPVAAGYTIKSIANIKLGL